MMVAAVLLFYRWVDKPEFLRKGFGLVVLNAAVFVTVCRDGEYRDLYFCLPILAMLGTHTLVSLIGADRFAIFKPATT